MRTGLLKGGELFLFLTLLLMLGTNAAVQTADANPPERTPRPTPGPTQDPANVVPTADRLAAPPTVENPTQADEGAQLYWLNCQPCHGDRGQGLTEEWRAQYPPEEQNCWTSGCHGNNPYENGFTLPEHVPAVVGEDSLEQFHTAGQLYTFMQATMPYQAPGSLEEGEYLAITAFLAREQGAWDGRPFDSETVQQVRLQPEAPPAPTTPPTSAERQTANSRLGWWWLLAAPVLLAAAWLWRRYRPA